MEFFAGVDTHRDTHSIALLNELGQVVDTFTIPTTPQGYAEAIARAAKFNVTAWGLEGIGSYGHRFAEELLRMGIPVYEIPGMISKRHRHRLRHRGKSDPQDAHAIAEALLRERSTLPRYVAGDAQEALRVLYERRDRKVRERTEKINQIRALGLRLGLKFATDLTTVRAMRAAEKLVSEQQPMRYATDEMLDDIRDLLVDVRRLHDAIAALEKRQAPFVERLCPQLPQLRGCSIISAAGLIGHTGPIAAYRNADAFAAHAGTAPVACSSGRHTSFRLNTGGNRSLNRCLHTIANTQIRLEGCLGKIYYERMRAAGKTHREAMRCLKRKLANVIFRIMRHAAVTQRNTDLILVAA